MKNATQTTARAELKATHDELHRIEAVMPDGLIKDQMHDRLLSIRSALAPLTPEEIARQKRDHEEQIFRAEGSQ